MNKNYIIVSSLDWDANWQIPHELTKTLVKNKDRVLYIENTGVRSVMFSDWKRVYHRIVNFLKSAKGFKRENDEFSIFSPILFPFPYSKTILPLNKYFYIGSDAIKSFIYKLSSEYINIPFIIFDLLKNPFKESICDVVIMLNVLEHIKDDNKALHEVNKILNNQGILIIEVPSGKFLYDEYDRKLLHFRRYNMKDIEKKLINSGFKIEKKTHLGFMVYPFFIVVKLFNKLFKNKNIVVKQAKASNNILLKILFNIEKKLQNIYLPFGIRCFICARKIK